jgi:hypothetical protein
MLMSPWESALETENARSDLGRPDRLGQAGNAKFSGALGASASDRNPSQSVRERRLIPWRRGLAGRFAYA